MEIDKQYCDCGHELTFDKVVEVIDRYDDKVLVVCSFYCTNCWDEYNINIEFNSIDFNIN